MTGFAFVILAAVVQAASVCPERLLCGRVVDEQQSGLAGASIALADGQVAVAEADGSFAIAAPAQPNARLTVTAEGYQASILNASDLAALGNVVQLAPEAAPQNDIVVTARRQSLPFTRQVIDKVELLTDPVANADALLAVAGLPTSTNLDNSADVQLRGSAIGLSRVYYNDVPLYEVVRGSSVDQVTRVASVFNANLIRDVETYPTLPPAYLANSAAGAVRILPDVDRDAPSSLFIGLPGLTLNRAGALPGEGEYQAYASAVDLSATLAVNPKLKATTTSFRSAALGGAARYGMGDGGELNLLSVVDVERGVFPLRILNRSGPSTSRRQRFYTVTGYEAPLGDARVKLDGALTATRNSLDYQEIETTSRNLYLYGNADIAGRWLDGRLEYRGGVSAEHFRLASSGTLDFATGVPVQGRAVRTAAYGAAHAFLTFRPSAELALAVGSRQFFAGTPDQRASYSAAATLASRDGRRKLILGAGTYSALVPPELGSTAGIAAARSRQLSVDYEQRSDAVVVRAGAYLKSDALAGIVTRIEGVDGSAQIRLSPTTLISGSFARSRQRSGGFRGDRDLGYLVRLQARVGLAATTSLNATYTLKSGAPFTRVLGGEDDGFGGVFPVFDPIRNGQRLRDYRTLDLNLVGRLPLGPPEQSPIAFVSVTNLFDRRNEARAVYDAGFTSESRIFYDRRAISFGIVKQF